MKTQLAKDNPHGPGRQGFAWEHVAAGHAVLDFGCHDGKTLAALRHDGVAPRLGVDLSADAIRQGRSLHPNLRLEAIGRGEPVPAPDASFDRVLLLDVIEHVADQRAILRELRRVLKADGRLVVTVPGRHLWSFLDFGNWKFRFPRAHRWWYVRRHGRDEYEYRYGDANPFGLCGDVERAKGIHEHFSRPSLTRLLRSAGFEPEIFDGTGYFHRPYAALSKLLPISPLWRTLTAWDLRWFSRAHLFCVAQPAAGER